MITVLSFLGFTGLVGFITWIMTHKDDHGTSKGYFLAGRSLTFPFIAGSLLLTNLSTEQMVGLNGAAFTDGLYFIPIFAVVLVGMLTNRVPARAAKIGMITGFAVLLVGYFLPLGHKSAELVVKDALVMENAKQVEFKVYLTKPVTYPLKVTFKTVNGTALSSENYIPQENITVTFDSGQTDASFTVPLKVDQNEKIADDSTFKRRTFFVKLAAPGEIGVKKSYASYNDSLAACRIIDNLEVAQAKAKDGIIKEVAAADDTAEEAPCSGFIYYLSYRFCS